MEPFWRCMFVRQHAPMLVTSIISICKTVIKVDLLDRYVYMNIYLIFKYCFICFNIDKKKIRIPLWAFSSFLGYIQVNVCLYFNISECWNNNILNIRYKDKVYCHYKMGRWSQFWFYWTSCKCRLDGLGPLAHLPPLSDVIRLSCHICLDHKICVLTSPWFLELLYVSLSGNVLCF